MKSDECPIHYIYVLNDSWLPTDYYGLFLPYIK